MQDQTQFGAPLCQRNVLNAALLANERTTATPPLGEHNKVPMFWFSFHEFNTGVRLPHLHRLLEQAQLSF